MSVFYIMMSIALTLAGSFWIDRLYKSSADSLTFPNEIQSRSRFRKPLLLICISFCIVNLINMPTPQMIYSIIAAYLLVLIMVTDFEQYVIFNKMLIPFALIGAVYIFHLNLPILNHLAAALLGGVIFLILALITKGGIGGGDIKLVAVLGLWFGIDDLLFIVVAASIMAGVAALIMIIFTKKSRRDYLAYGPYFSISAIYCLLFQ
ncbi:MAG: prepilin peptidase [Selenomonadaceae bacterium]|nr:prepilin peptidase [Selenomonadaceae bacterium]